VFKTELGQGVVTARTQAKTRNSKLGPGRKKRKMKTGAVAVGRGLRFFLIGEAGGPETVGGNF